MDVDFCLFFKVNCPVIQKRKVKFISRTPPSHLLLKLNIDIASKGNPGDSGEGAVLRNARGDFIFVVAMAYGSHTNSTADFLALLDDLLGRYLGLV